MEYDITGTWNLFETFEAGFDYGVAVLVQTDQEIKGTLVYYECIEDEEPFLISVDVEGAVDEDGLVYLNGVYYEMYDCEGDYSFDDRTGNFVDYDTISGESVDEQGVVGKFYFKRAYQ